MRFFLDRASPPPEPNGVDAKEVLRLAVAHAVVPMVYRAVESTIGGGEIAETLRPVFDEDVRFSLALAADLCALADLLKSRDLSFLPIKGPLLSQRLYGDLAIRASGDLDILVRREDVLAIKDLLIARGYRIASPLHWSGDSACLRSRECELMMIRQPQQPALDLHWRPLPRYFASPFDEVSIWDSLISTPFSGREFPDLPNERLLLFLCAHGGKHAFERLGWIADIAAFLRIDKLDWKSILDIAKRSATTRQLLVGVHLAADLLGAPLPSYLLEDREVVTLVGLVKDRLLSAETPPTAERELIPFCFRLLESRSHRLRYLAGHLSPSSAEYQLIRLPPSLYFIYYVLRPLRLGGRLVSGRNR